MEFVDRTLSLAVCGSVSYLFFTFILAVWGVWAVAVIFTMLFMAMLLAEIEGISTRVDTWLFSARVGISVTAPHYVFRHINELYGEWYVLLCVVVFLALIAPLEIVRLRRKC